MQNEYKHNNQYQLSFLVKFNLIWKLGHYVEY